MKFLVLIGFMVGVITSYAQLDTPSIDTLPMVQISKFVNENAHNAVKVKKLRVMDIRDLAMNSLSDLLKGLVPVYIKEYGTGLALPSIRGTGASHTQVYWNGVPVNSPTLGQTDLSIFNGYMNDQINVNLGSGNAYSSGSLGGSIEMNDQLKWGRDSSVWFRQKFGSFDTRSSVLKFARSSERLSISTKASYSHARNNFTYTDRTTATPTEKKLENADVEIMSLNTMVGWRKKDHRIQGAMFLSGANRGLPTIIGVPGKGERQLDQSTFITVDYSIIKKRFQNQLKFALVDIENRYFNPILSINSGNLGKTRLVQNETEVEISKTLDVVTQFAYRTEMGISNNYGEDKQRDILSNYTRLRWRKNLTMLSVSLRSENVDGEWNPLLPTFSGTQRFDRLREGLRLRWNISKNYRLPTLNDLYWNPGGNPLLQPEMGYSGDVGALLNVGRQRFNATFFHSDISNWILWTPTGQYWSPSNVKRVTNSGVELKYEYNRTEPNGWNGLVSYAYVNNTVKESIVENDLSIGKSLIFVPRHNLRLALIYGVKSWTFAYNQSFTSRVFIDAANESYMPYYAPSSLTVSKRYVDGGGAMWKMGGKVNNLFNEEYQVMPNRPMPGIGFDLIFELLF